MPVIFMFLMIIFRLVFDNDLLVFHHRVVYGALDPTFV